MNNTLTKLIAAKLGLEQFDNIPAEKIMNATDFEQSINACIVAIDCRQYKDAAKFAEKIKETEQGKDCPDLVLIELARQIERNAEILYFSDELTNNLDK